MELIVRTKLLLNFLFQYHLRTYLVKAQTLITLKVGTKLFVKRFSQLRRFLRNSFQAKEDISWHIIMSPFSGTSVVVSVSLLSKVPDGV